MADLMDDSDYDLDEGEDITLLPIGSTVRVTVPEGGTLQYQKGAFGKMKPGDSFVGVIAGVVPAHTITRTEPAPAGASGSRARALANVTVTEHVADAYKVVGFGSDKLLKPDGVGLDHKPLGDFALTARKAVLVPGEWSAAAPEVRNLTERMEAATSRNAMVKDLLGGRRGSAQPGLQLLAGLKNLTPQKTQSGVGSDGQPARAAEDQDGADQQASQGGGLVPPLADELEEEEEFGITKRGVGGPRPSHLCVLSSQPTVLAAAAAAGAECMALVKAGAVVSAKAVQTL